MKIIFLEKNHYMVCYKVVKDTKKSHRAVNCNQLTKQLFIKFQ